MDIDILKKIGFNDKTAKIYLALLNLGPSSVRNLADFCGLNRGTTYDNLKWLQENGAVNYYQKETKQFFVAEDPDKLRKIIDDKKLELADTNKKLDKMIPELQALYNSGGQRPVARYYERKEIKEILEDVLEVCEMSGELEYRIYSPQGMREYLYEDFETFSDVRIAKNIKVKAIAIGQGGETRGLDERKWIDSQAGKNETYIIIYPGKTAYISLDKQSQPIGVVIENVGIYETQKIIFDNLWKLI